MGLSNNRTIRISTDGGKTWHELEGQLLELSTSSDTETKTRIEVLNIPCRIGLSMGIENSVIETMEKLAESLRASRTHAPASGKKKAQWKQNPLGRYRR